MKNVRRHGPHGSFRPRYFPSTYHPTNYTKPQMSRRYQLMAIVEKTIYGFMVIMENSFKFFLVGCERALLYTLMAIEIVVRAMIYVLLALAVMAVLLALMWLVTLVVT